MKRIVSETALPSSGSTRKYSRLVLEDGSTAVRAVGTDADENAAFIYLSGHFRSKGIPVPEVLEVSPDGMSYIQEDLGAVSLWDAVAKGRSRAEAAADRQESSAAGGPGNSAADRPGNSAADGPRNSAADRPGNSAAGGTGSHVPQASPAGSGAPASAYTPAPAAAYSQAASEAPAAAYSQAEEALLVKAVRALPKIQFEGAEGMDFSVCYPEPEFGERTVDFDLNYFKYCFLKPSGAEFNEIKLQRDFDSLRTVLLEEKSIGFMYRDFQTRNVLIRDGEPWFIDFQGGRRGPALYDLASFVYQARSRFPDALKGRLIAEYADVAQRYCPGIGESIRERLAPFVLFRCLQTLGAYGFRGLVQGRRHFVESIPAALAQIRGLLAEGAADRWPYLAEVLGALPERWTHQAEVLGVLPERWMHQTEVLGVLPERWTHQAEVLGMLPERSSLGRARMTPPSPATPGNPVPCSAGPAGAPGGADSAAVDGASGAPGAASVAGPAGAPGAASVAGPAGAPGGADPAAPGAAQLVVDVLSFSYRRGLPDDDSGNGGGYIFDCRAIHNPGRYDRYKQLTGRDRPVIEFLEQGTEAAPFLDHVFALLDAHTAKFLSRGFTHFQVAFGCTGGQHRSVYCAERTAAHLREKFGVKVRLTHRESPNWPASKI